MPAKLHFAEDSLALHLLLEGLEGLIDIVVANEYLHGLSYILRPGLERSENCGALADTTERKLQRLYQTGYFLSRALARPRPKSRFPCRAHHGIEQSNQDPCNE